MYGVMQSLGMLGRGCAEVWVSAGECSLPRSSALQQLCLAVRALHFTLEHEGLEQTQRKMMETALAYSPLGHVLPGT